jgi:hypothetical protein
VPCPVLLPACVQTAVDIDGHPMELQEFAGKVTIFVNVASKCGYTDANYKGEQAALIAARAGAACWLLHLQHVLVAWKGWCSSGDSDACSSCESWMSCVILHTACWPH